MSLSPQLLRRTRWVAPVACAALLSAAEPASAEPSPEQVAARRQLIEQAQAAREAADHARALELASLAGELSMSVSLRRFIAEEQLALGQSAAALGSAELCARDAKVPGALGAEHLGACEALAAQAREHVGFVVLRLEPSAPGARVTIGGHEMPGALLGQRYVVTAGEAHIEVSAEGFAPAEARVTVEPGREAEVSLKLVAAPRRLPAPKPPAPARGFHLSPLLPVGGSVALSGLAVALGVGVSGKLALDDYEARCTSAGAAQSCRGEQSELQADLDTRSIVVNTALGVAGVGLVLGTVGVFMSGTSDAQKAALWQGKVLF